MKLLFVSADPRVVLHGTSALVGDPDVEITELPVPEGALRLLEDGEQFDVIVVDADIAPTGGFYLTREIASLEVAGRPMPPVLVLIARPQDRWLASWSQAGASAQKPIEPFDLAAVVRALAAGAPLPDLPGVHPGRPRDLLDSPGPPYDQRLLVSGTPPQHARDDHRA